MNISFPKKDSGSLALTSKEDWVKIRDFLCNRNKFSHCQLKLERHGEVFNGFVKCKIILSSAYDNLVNGSVW